MRTMRNVGLVALFSCCLCVSSAVLAADGKDGGAAVEEVEDVEEVDPVAVVDAEASGLTATVGFKNGTDGNIDVAVNAMRSVAQPHSFVSINPEGDVSVIRTSGNPNTHLILRGGNAPNYSVEHVAAGFEPRIMVDCSHDNSQKDPLKQEGVLADVIPQKQGGNRSIMGVMLESNLNGGTQSIPADPAALAYSVSITDACIDWETAERLIRGLRSAL